MIPPKKISEVQITKDELNKIEDEEKYLYEEAFESEMTEAFMSETRRAENTLLSQKGAQEVLNGIEFPNIDTGLDIKNAYINTTKAIKELKTADNKINQGMYKLETLPSKGCMITLNMFSDPNIKVSSHNLTAFDLAVADAVYTLIRSGYMIASNAMIRRVMSGNVKQVVRQNLSAAIDMSMLKLKSVTVEIDYSNEVRARGLEKKYGTRIYGGYSSVVEFQKRFIKANNGKIVSAYFFSRSILYEYAECIGQVASVPIRYLETASILPDTDENVVIKKYLLSRIMAVNNRKGKSISNRIIYERNGRDGELKGMFPELGFARENFQSNRSWLNKRQKLHKIVITYLEKFQEDKLIKDFKVITCKRRIVGIELIGNKSI